MISERKEKCSGQGDVFLVEVNRIPKGAKPVEPIKGRYILKEGEFSGHAHAVKENTGVLVYEKDGMLYLDTSQLVEEEFDIMHEQHYIIKGKKNKVYMIDEQQSKNWVSEMVEPVRD